MLFLQKGRFLRADFSDVVFGKLVEVVELVPHHADHFLCLRRVQLVGKGKAE